MQNDIKSLVELQTLYINLVSQALDNTLDKLLKKLKELIQDDVYNWKSESDDPWGLRSGQTLGLTSGMRTGEFYDSWEKMKLILTGGYVTGQISESLDVMHQVGWRVHENRDELAEIINSGNGYNFGQCEARPYWTDWISWVELNIEAIFYKECVDVGLPLQNMSWGIQ